MPKTFTGWISVDIPYAMTNNGWDGSLLSVFSISGSGRLSPFITGIEPLTRESYNVYVQHIKDMGIEHCLEIYQTAYERYLER